MKPPAHPLLLVLLLLAYIGAGKLGLRLAVVNASATAVWLPTGIALAMLLISGWRAWPAVLLGAFVVNATSGGTLGTSAAIAAGNTLEALAGCALVERMAGGTRAFARAQHIFLFVLAVAIAATVSASAGVGALIAAGAGGHAPPPAIWVTWWVGDVTGAIIACPLVLLWLDKPRIPIDPRRTAEAAALATALALAGMVAFADAIAPLAGHPLAFICLPTVLWAAFRFGARGAATAMLLLLAIALPATLGGHGSFSGMEQNASLLTLQSFLAVTTVTGLVVAAVVDERKRLEGELVRKAEELSRSNQELEHYAYVASHDLQEPLRLIASYSQLLDRRYRGKLDGKADEFLAHIVANTSRMREFIKALLEYSRVGKADAPREEVPLDDLLRDTLAGLQLPIAEAGAAITSDPLPRVSGNRLELQQVLQNLVSNALKFRGSEPPRIHVGARREHGEWTISVRDNGIGIDAQEAAKVFEIFRRSAASSSRPGSGIGLAVCKKVVERHGGRIWVEVAPGPGTTISFTLPVMRG